MLNRRNLMKKFNTTGICIPTKHYMVNTSNKLAEIIDLIDEEEYFTINRSRQFGKTTTLFALENSLKDRMEVIFISFEGVGDAPFNSNKSFVSMVISRVAKAMRFTNIIKDDIAEWSKENEYSENTAIEYLSEKITDLCQKYEVILMIDEMDKCSDNQVFLNFLGMLRAKYLNRNIGRDFTFKSVILAGVYDVKNLKLKFRQEEEKKYNSPWNIAIDFNVDMSFHPEEIATMLEAYETDAHTGMDIKTISEELYHYTNGYPYLVSWLCKWIEEQGDREWSVNGIQKASKVLLMDRTPLFDDMIKNIEHYSGLREIIEQVLYSGNDVPFSLSNGDIALGAMFGILSQKESKAVVSNIMFETYLYDYFSLRRLQKGLNHRCEKSQFIKEDGHLDMVRVLDRFQAFMKSEYREEDEKFLENQGRLLFLCFLKPIINGTGFYYVEPETRNSSRMDIVVTYLDEEFIIELKIWHGDSYRKDGIKQLNGYLDSREHKKGYLVSFSFLKNKEYTQGYLSDVKNDEIPGIEDKQIYEVVV